MAQDAFHYSEVAEQQFAHAVSMFEEEKYNEAVQLFDSLSHQKPIHQRTTAAQLMEAKSLFQLKQYNRSVALLDSLLETYPYTSYAGDIHYTLGENYTMLQRYQNASRSFIKAMEATNDSILDRHIQKSFILLADQRLDAVFLNQLRLQATHEDVGDLLTLKTAEKDLRDGHTAHARALIDERLKLPHHSTYGKFLAALLSKENEPAGFKIGVVLPLMTRSSGNGVAALAKEMLDGMNFAAGEYASAAHAAARVTLDVRDTERDSVLAVRAVQELSASKDVVCIVGPLFSNLVSACASIVNREHVPLISPTATTNGLAASGRYVFQMHPDFATRGTIMARYAIREMGYRTLAILSSTEPIGASVAESFSGEAQRLGARVIAMETFPRNANDIREQCMSIRRSALDAYPTISFAKLSRTDFDKLLKAGVNRRRIDSLVAVGGSIPATKLLGPQGVRIADSLRIKLSSPATESENLNVPVTSIDAIFVAIDDAEEIGVIGSQLNYFNIKAQFLGNNEWYDPTQLDAQKQYVNGVVFASDTYIDEHDPHYLSFVQSFRSTGGKQPTKYTLIGYDVLKLILSQAGGGQSSREVMTDALSKIREFKGLHSSITLSGGRVNSTMHMMKYSNGEVRKIGESTRND